VPRRDNRAMFSHYQSDLARQRQIGINVDDDQESNLQIISTSGPEGSTGHDPSPSSQHPTRMKNDSFSGTAVQRRSGTDNRRFPIVLPLKLSDTSPPGRAKEHETSQYSPSVSSAVQATLPSPSPSAGRRALVVDAQLAAATDPALGTVAPQDTTNLYSTPTSLTPSSSPSHSPTTPKSSHPPSSASSAKSRKARDSVHARSSSRDIGIVGTVTRHELLLPQDFSTLSDKDTPKYRPPIFQTPSARSSFPDISTPVDTLSVEPDPAVQTPSSGTPYVRPSTMSASVEPVHSASSVMNGHEVHSPPHSLHVLATSSPRHHLINSPEQGTATSPVSSPTVSSAPSSYLYYQPGVHAKAGPLPPPPRAMFDIDFNAPPPPRPPRLRSPSPLTSQKPPGAATPTSVTVRLASKASTASIHQLHISATPPLNTTKPKSKSSSEDSDYSPE